MTLRCKPDDLCVIIAAEIPDDIGIFVTVKEYIVGIEGWTFEKASRPIAVGLRTGRLAKGWINSCDHLPYRAVLDDLRLKPIRGAQPGTPTTTKTPRPEPVEAQ